MVELRRLVLGLDNPTNGTSSMNRGREIRSYDYVNHPYERVREALTQNALTVFQSATKAAEAAPHKVAQAPVKPAAPKAHGKKVKYADAES